MDMKGGDQFEKKKSFFFLNREIYNNVILLLVGFKWDNDS